MDIQTSQPIWGYLLHLGYNMWCDREVTRLDAPYYSAKPYLRCDESLWNDLLPSMSDAGINLVVIDLGEGFRYHSHPELAVEGSWEPDRLAASLDHMRQLGLEPIPKLNFSTCHDTWLGPYARMVSTPEYYRACADLIAEVVELFETPRFFHLGMDEENLANQVHHEHVVIRQHDLWWHDLEFYLAQLEPRKVRGWVWADYVWENRDAYLARMPKSVVQSNWYYGRDFSPDNPAAEAYDALDGAGFEQVPTGSTWEYPGNFADTVRYCRDHLAADHLLGFLQSAWHPTLEEVREVHLRAIGEVAKARATFG